MQRIILIMVMALSLPSVAKSQSAVTYSYDAAGSRTGRNITVAHVKSRESTDIRDVDENDEMHVCVTVDYAENAIRVEVADYADGDDLHISLYDAGGRVIIDNAHSSSPSIIELSHHPKGVYILQVVLNGRNDSWKISVN